jgi:hypothetical protein
MVATRTATRLFAESVSEQMENAGLDAAVPSPHTTPLPLSDKCCSCGKALPKRPGSLRQRGFYERPVSMPSHVTVAVPRGRLICGPCKMHCYHTQASSTTAKSPTATTACAPPRTVTPLYTHAYGDGGRSSGGICGWWWCAWCCVCGGERWWVWCCVFFCVMH